MQNIGALYQDRGKFARNLDQGRRPPDGCTWQTCWGLGYAILMRFDQYVCNLRTETTVHNALLSNIILVSVHVLTYICIFVYTCLQHEILIQWVAGLHWNVIYEKLIICDGSLSESRNIIRLLYPSVPCLAQELSMLSRQRNGNPIATI